MSMKASKRRSGLLPDQGSKPSRSAIPPLKSNRDMLSQLGTPRSMPDEVRSRMEQSLGADFSGVQLYESPIVAEHGAMAAASGNAVAFAPGQMNFGSSAGLETLGHELSHVASQAKGESRGSGFLKDPALERKADAEGFKAAHGALDSASGKTLSPMSAGLGSLSANAPIQARKKTEAEKFNEAYSQLEDPELANDEDVSQARINMLKDSYNRYRRGDLDEDSQKALGNAIQSKLDGLSEMDSKTFLDMQNSAYVQRDEAEQNLASEWLDSKGRRENQSNLRKSDKDIELYDAMDTALQDNTTFLTQKAKAGNAGFFYNNGWSSIDDDDAFYSGSTLSYNRVAQRDADIRKAAKSYKYQIPKNVQQKIKELNKKKKKK